MSPQKPPVNLAHLTRFMQFVSDRKSLEAALRQAVVILAGAMEVMVAEEVDADELVRRMKREPSP